MFSTDDDIKEILENPSNLANQPKPEPRRQITDYSERQRVRVIEPEIVEDKTEIHPLHNGGRRLGDKNLTKSQRTEIAIAARTLPVEQVAEMYGVSLHHVNELKHGKITNAAGPNQELIDEVNKETREPHKLALDRLAETLTQITPEKLQRVSKTKDLVQIAVGLSQVARATAPIDVVDPSDAGAKLVVYAPSFKQENHYESVPVQSQK